MTEKKLPGQHGENPSNDPYSAPDRFKDPEAYRTWLLTELKDYLVHEPQETWKRKERKPSAEEQTLINTFKQRFIDAFEGKSFPEAERDRALNYFGGVSEAMATFDATAGRDRDRAIKAIGQALDNPNVKQSTKADLVGTFVISAYDITQVHESMMRLAEKRTELENPLLEGVLNYFAFRELHRRTAQGKISPLSPR